MRVALAVGFDVVDYGRVCMATLEVDDPMFYVGTTATRGDELARLWAVANGLVVEWCFAPRGDRRERNRRMLEFADVAVVVCNPGTDPDMDDLIAQAEALGVPLVIG